VSLDDLKSSGGRKAAMLKVNRDLVVQYHAKFGREATCRAFYMGERTLDRFLGQDPCTDYGLHDTADDRLRRLEHRQDGYEQTQDIVRNEVALGREVRLEQVRATKAQNELLSALRDQHNSWADDVADGLWRRVKPLVAEALRRLIPDQSGPEYQAAIERGEQVVHITQDARNPFERSLQELSFFLTGSHNIYCAYSSHCLRK
jgi:hypothetical protein